jgi:hypothetical protein
MKTEGCSIYQHRRADNGQIFYVGKASNPYRKVKTQNRNSRWHEIVNEAGGFTAEEVVSDVDEDLSLLAEQEYIDKLKKLGIPICNLTTGGQGRSGWKPSEETRRIWSEQRKGRVPYNKGTKKPYIKKTEEELKEIRLVAAVKQSQALKGRTPWNKGTTYENINGRGVTPWNKGQRVVGSKRWKIDQRKLERTKP